VNRLTFNNNTDMSHLHDWSVEDTCSWLDSIGLGDAVATFRAHKLGASMLLLSSIFREESIFMIDKVRYLHTNSCTLPFAN